MLATRDIVTWIFGQISGWDVEIGPYEPEMPDKIILVTRVAGPGLAFESTFDYLAYHVAVRGSQRNYDDAEATAQAVDAMFVDAPFPMVINHWYIQSMSRMSSTPSPLPTTVDGERITFTATYVVCVGRRAV